ncbi:MAG: glycosyltransferase [Deltaproteobacteria bacterium]|nr:glycosyltransferase [Deltaproteobacteria bacterium]NND28013.1 glycosyltransferase [Myxococcales bacterium]MBT8465524.1 glycosyltransferase [Deltaproteobacteria bacterium]NNK08220.1 glycosyltransferase [Myxococcales bacterium]NNK44746.1 glycosyltransferase [Myxococcales bacterium]
MSHIIAPGLMAGAENVVLHGCTALVANGHELSLLVIVDERCREYGETFLETARKRSIPAEAIEVRGRVDLRALMKLRARFSARRTEIVHAHGYKALAYAMLARNRRLSLVVTHHGETGHDRLARFYEGLARTLYSRVDCVFSVSSATTELLVAAGVPRAKLRTVPNPISLPPPSSDPGAGPSKGALLFVGRLSKEKGLDVLLRALASSRTPNHLTLDVAGDGPCADEWKALCSKLGLDRRVRWLGVRSDIPALLAEAQALVLPSLREGLPLAVLEAGSSEVPVLASRVGGVPEAVWEGETAVLIAPGEVDEWVNALEAFPAQAETLRNGARRRGAEIRARHAPERWAERTTRHYREVAK